MADLVSFVLTVSTTLVLQGGYYVLLPSRSKLTTEFLSLRADQQAQMDRIADAEDTNEVLQAAIAQLADLHDKLGTKQPPLQPKISRIHLLTVLGQLRGLEVVEQPLASNVQKVTDAVAWSADVVNTWTGDPEPEMLEAFAYRYKTLLYSGRAVKRAHDRQLGTFWDQMEQRCASLRALTNSYTASVIGLEIATAVLLAFSFQLMAQRHWLHLGWAWAGWGLSCLVMYTFFSRVMVKVRPTNTFILQLAAQVEAYRKSKSEGSSPAAATAAAVSLPTVQATIPSAQAAEASSVGV